MFVRDSQRPPQGESESMEIDKSGDPKQALE